MASSFNNILNIPGLAPVDLHSSDPYPVPFSPVIRPPRSSAPAAPTTYPDPGSLPSSAPPPSSANISGGGGYTDPYSGSVGMAGDPLFALSGGGFGGYGGGGGQPDFSAYYGGDINPAQLSGWGNVLPNIGTGLENYGQGVWDRIQSIGDKPYISNDNLAQAGINAAGMFIPGASALAGILQGFNLLDPGETTGNPLADVAMTPGAAQNLFANGANWLNRQFGGDYMPSSYIPPTMYDLPAGYDSSVSYQDNMNPGWGGAGGNNAGTAAPAVDQSSQQGYSFGSDLGGPTFQINPLDNLAGYYGPGGQAYDIGGAGIFNSIGLSPLMTGDMGGLLSFGDFSSLGGGGGGGWGGGGSLSADNNGGWGQ